MKTKQKPIELSERFILKSERHNWILVQTVPSITKKGEPCFKKIETFHRDLKQVANWLVNESLKEAETVVELAELAAKAEVNVETFLKEQTLSL